MTNDLELQQARDLLDDFQQIDSEPVKNKLSTAINSLAFLFSLPETKDDEQNAPAAVTA